MKRLTTGESHIANLTIGRATNEVLEAAVAVWHKDEDQIAGEVIGPIWIEVLSPADVTTPLSERGPAPDLSPFALATLSGGVEWFPRSTAEALASELKVEVKAS